MAQPAIWFLAVRCGSGADVFTERLCSALNARGIRSEITWLPHRAEYAPWTVPAPSPPPWANVVHVNSWLHQRFVPPELPVIATVHSCVHDLALLPYKSCLQALYHKYWIYPIEAASFRRAQCIVAVSHYTAGKIKAEFGIQDVKVVHNGIDCQVFTSVARKEPNYPFRLLYVGNWSARKGVDLLRPIMERLGNGFVLQYTADRSGAHARFRLPPNALCLGRITGPELVRAYQNADALIFPSRLEGFGLVAAEAMACGLPVIATNATSLTEVVEDGVTGFLISDGDTENFAKVCRYLSNHAGVWAKMCCAAKQRSLDFFSIQPMTESYIALYYEVL